MSIIRHLSKQIPCPQNILHTMTISYDMIQHTSFDNKNVPTLILIHGTATNAKMFHPMMSLLHNKYAGKYNIIAFNLPGNGLSSPIPEYILNTHPIAILDYIISLLDHTLLLINPIIEYDTTTIVGHSFGALIATWWAKKRQFKKLCIANAIGIQATLSMYGYLWAVVFKLKVPDILYRFLNRKQLTYPTTYIAHKFITFYNIYAYWNTVIYPILLALSTPLHIIHGYHDPIAPLHHALYLHAERRQVYKKASRCDIITHAAHSTLYVPPLHQQQTSWPPHNSLNLFKSYIVSTISYTKWRCLNYLDSYIRIYSNNEFIDNILE